MPNETLLDLARRIEGADEHAPRTPESLTRLERAWLKRRACAWCEAPTHVNACYAMQGSMRVGPRGDRSTFKFPPQCTDAELNERRGRWLAEAYKPRARAMMDAQG